jgi:hypothetical protein
MFLFIISYKPLPDRSWGMIRGIILERTDGLRDVYRRVGMFNHPWDTGNENIMKSVVRHHYPPPPPGKPHYFPPEFAGFDPDNMERTTVTII